MVPHHTRDGEWLCTIYGTAVEIDARPYWPMVCIALQCVRYRSGESANLSGDFWSRLNHVQHAED
jgi:hypothetical protein